MQFKQNLVLLEKIETWVLFQSEEVLQEFGYNPNEYF